MRRRLTTEPSERLSVGGKVRERRERLLRRIACEARRTRWWTVPFMLPVVNLIAYWFYAFTLPCSAAAAT
jgi:hypothetical protein